MTPWRAVQAQTAGATRRFETSLARPRDAQLAELGVIVSANARSAFGRSHGFDTISDVDDYRQRVPVQRYDDLAPDIEATCEHGQADTLVCEPVVLCEQTSGTSMAPRLIPYTASSLKAFQRALYPWLHDLARQWPAVTAGRAYFAVSPALRRPAHTGAGIALGAGNDGVYFGPELARALHALSVVPTSLAGVSDLDPWRYLTLRCLLDADDLALLSVWSPSFLTTLLDGLQGFASALVREVARGTALAPDGTAAGLEFKPRPARARTVAAALDGDRPDTRALWPRLTVISCWSHGSAARFLPALTRAMPGVAVQGKGLLATEGVVSIPFADNAYPVLALDSGFFEFIDHSGHSLLADEVRVGETYSVLLTTHGGLYRYDIGDRVRVRGHALAAPTLEFVGRGDAVSDLCGEKVTEEQVQSGLQDVSGFALLAAHPGQPPGYRLVLDAAERDGEAAERLAHRLDCRLRENPHYDYARRLGQLGPILPEPREQPLTAFLQWQSRRGRRLGTIKPPVLYGQDDWQRIFKAD